MRKFKTEEDLIEYYEMKAIDKIIKEDEEEEEKVQYKRRDRLDSLKKNILKYEK